jgi:predicted O-linked N-acetylglucosamine transferase (SPINDLY family)
MLLPDTRSDTVPTPPVSGDTIRATFGEAVRRAREATQAPAPADLAAARAHLERGWPGLAAAALLAPAWALPESPPLSEVPDAHWGDYLDWLLARPARGTDGVEAAALARQLARRVSEIADWMDRNLAAPAVLAAAAAYGRADFSALDRLPAEHLPALQTARARILARLHGRAAASRSPLPRDRRERPLRVGFLRRRHALDSSGCRLLARLSHLDEERAQAVLFTLEAEGCDPVFTGPDRDFRLLPGTLAQQIEALRVETLDVLVYADDLSSHPAQLAWIALHRVAPLQLVDVGEAPTCGLAAVDLRVAGAADFARLTDGTERVALLPATAHAFDLTVLARADAPEAGRALLGLPQNVPLLLAVLPPANLRPSTLARWVRALHDHPTTALVLALECPEAHPARVDTLGRLSESGIATERIHLIDAGDGFVDLPRLAGLADVCLDPTPFAAALAFEACTPAVALAASPAAALFRVAGLAADLGASDEDWRRALATRLADPAESRRRVESAHAQLPAFADTYAAAQDFTALLEAAWDELVALGSARFRRQRAPVRSAAPHSPHPGDLQAEGRVLIARGRPERAIPCLLSAIQRAGSDATLWFDLALAYRAAGQPRSALESLEASLRLDDRNFAAWIAICELAADVGSLDFAREALALAAELRPEDERLPALRARVAA